MIEMLFLLCLSVICAGVFLKMEYKTMLSASFLAAVSGGAVFYLGRNILPEPVAFGAGLIIGEIYAFLREKRSVADGVLACCIGGCQWGLWTAFRSALGAASEEDIVLFLYSAFYQLHIPAVLLTYPPLSLSRDWQARLSPAQKISHGWIPVLGLVQLALICGFSLLPVPAGWPCVCKSLLMSAMFWAVTGVTVLLVAYGQKREQSSAEQGYHESMRTFMNVVRSQRHDYNLHVQTVASLIAQEKWDECRSYVNALSQDTAQMNAVLPVKDPAVAALIHNYRTLAAQRGITILTDIRDDMARVVTSAYETNKIIGNLLQNALDELEQQLDCGTVELCIFKRGEYCMIRVSNQVADPEAFSRAKESLFRQGFTTKQGHDGVGLSSIQALSRQVGGDVTAWLEGKTVHFVASIPMRLEAESEGGPNGNLQN